MAERPFDRELEASTERWMIAGLILIVIMVLAFPAYRLLEPASRDEARQILQESQEDSGAALFSLQCVACHGQDALGGTAPALNSKQFLSMASDKQVVSLIAVGIPGSAMQAYSLDFGGPLTLEQITALTAYIRSLETDAPDNPDWRAMIEPAG